MRAKIGNDAAGVGLDEDDAALTRGLQWQVDRRKTSYHDLSGTAKFPFYTGALYRI